MCWMMSLGMFEVFLEFKVNGVVIGFGGFIQCFLGVMEFLRIVDGFFEWMYVVDCLLYFICLFEVCYDGVVLEFVVCMRILGDEVGVQFGGWFDMVFVWFVLVLVVNSVV